jgi:hypothetical protein
MREDTSTLADRVALAPANFQVPKRKPASDTMMGDIAEAAKSKLDSPANMAIWSRLISFYQSELEKQSGARREMEKDEAFYDNDQWEAADVMKLQQRGQEALVFNLIAQSINWIIGTERRGRTNYKILPRRQETAQAAEKKTALMKYLDDTNMAEFHWSRAFAEQVKAGLSWMEGGVQDDDEGEPIFDRFVSWRNLLADSAATDLDCGDGRFMFRSKWVDSDFARATFKGREHIIDSAISRYHDYGASLDRMGDSAMDSHEEEVVQLSSTTTDHPSYSRDRVRLIEAWFRVPEETYRMRGGEFRGELYDPWSPGHVEDIESGRAKLIKKVVYRMYVAVMTTTGLLWLSPSPYRHNRFPFTPLVAYRKAKDNSPYGVIRNMRDAQRDINKRLSKAQYILNSRVIIMDEGAVEDIDELEEEAARPDPIIVKKVGRAFEMKTERELAASHLELMGMSTNMIQSLSGVTDESLGRTTNASSGKAIIARQQQGALSTAPIFDNLRMARQFHGEKRLSLIEQFTTEEKQFRITNQRGVPDYITVNDGLPENDIVRSKADYVIAEDDYNATMRQAAVEQFLDLAAKIAPVAPQIVMVMLDLLIESMDLPNGEELVKRVRQITGMEDPDADPNTPDPEREARKAEAQRQAQMAARAEEANLRTIEAKAAETEAKAAKIATDTDKVRADIQRALETVPREKLADMKTALELAIQMMEAAPAVDTADALLQTTGAQPAPMPPPPSPQMVPPAPMAPEPTPQQEMV